MTEPRQEPLVTPLGRRVIYRAAVGLSLIAAGVWALMGIDEYIDRGLSSSVVLSGAAAVGMLGAAVNSYREYLRLPPAE